MQHLMYDCLLVECKSVASVQTVGEGHKSILSVLFVESLDLVVAASEDRNICEFPLKTFHTHEFLFDT